MARHCRMAVVARPRSFRDSYRITPTAVIPICYNTTRRSVPNWKILRSAWICLFLRYCAVLWWKLTGCCVVVLVFDFLSALCWLRLNCCVDSRKQTFFCNSILMSRKESWRGVLLWLRLWNFWGSPPHTHTHRRQKSKSQWLIKLNLALHLSLFNSYTWTGEIVLASAEPNLQEVNPAWFLAFIISKFSLLHTPQSLAVPYTNIL